MFPSTLMFPELFHLLKDPNPLKQLALLPSLIGKCLMCLIQAHAQENLHAPCSNCQTEVNRTQKATWNSKNQFWPDSSISITVWNWDKWVLGEKGKWWKQNRIGGLDYSSILLSKYWLTWGDSIPMCAIVLCPDTQITWKQLKPTKR